MGKLKTQLEQNGVLTIEELQHATVSNNLEDIFVSRLYVIAKIQDLVEHFNKHKSDTTFGFRTELKQYRLILDLLKKRYNKVSKRKAQRNQQKITKQQKFELANIILQQAIAKREFPRIGTTIPEPLPQSITQPKLNTINIDYSETEKLLNFDVLGGESMTKMNPVK